MAADVASPARRLWPAYRSGSRPAALGRPLHDPGDVLVRQPGGPDAAEAIDGPEDRPAVGVELLQPGRERADGAGRRVLAPGDADLPPLALLIGLAAPDGDDRALTGQLDVALVERHQLGAAEGPGEAEQDERAVPDAGRASRAPPPPSP